LNRSEWFQRRNRFKRLDFSNSDYQAGRMPSRPKSPRETIKVRRLPAKGETLKLNAEVVRVAEG